MHATLAVLGPVEVRVDGRPIHLPRRETEVVARLAIDGGRAVSAERIADSVWEGAPPPTAVKSVQVYVNRIRRRLGPDSVRTDASGYLLDPATARATDARFFEEFLTRARGSAPAEQVAIFDEALGLWRGPAFGDLADREWARAEATRLDELRLVAIELRAEAQVSLHDPLVVAELESLVDAHPLRERLWELLMVALFRSGRQADALEAYQRARRMLREEVGLEPGPSLRATEAAVLAQTASLESPPVTAVEVPPGWLPPETTTFVGRASDLASVTSLLAENRLVTLTGAGGAGKTRLAVRVAAAIRTDVPDGTWFVDLAGSEGVLHGVLAAFGAAPRGERDAARAAIGLLRDRRVLLVLDNCEHVAEEAAAFARRVLAECTAVKLLATSRAPLGVAGESVWPVTPLAEDDAVRLFVDRARSSNPRFDADDDSLPHIAAICRRLDGIPLAIELAAAWTNVLGVGQIEARLDDRFSLLTTRRGDAVERHRTLRAAIEWGYALLDDETRSLLDALSVFPAPFTIEAATAVADTDVLQALGRLVDASLVVADAGHVNRYRLLESVREYAAERLAGDEARAEAVSARYSRHYVALADRAWRELTESSQVEVLDLLEADIDNVRAALAWAGESDVASAQRIVADAADALLVRGHADEVVAMATSALVRGPVDPVAHAGAIAALGEAQRLTGDPASIATARDALRLGRAVGAPRAVVRAGLTLCSGMLPVLPSDVDPDELERAEIAGGRRHPRSRLLVDFQRAMLVPQTDLSATFDDVLRDAERRGDWISATHAHGALAARAAIDGHVEGAARHLRHAIDIARRIRYVPALIGAAGQLVEVQSRAGDLSEAERALGEVREVGEALSLTNVVATAHGQLGLAARRVGAIDRAIECFGESARLHRAAGDRFHELAITAFAGRTHMMRGDLPSARRAIDEARRGLTDEFGAGVAAVVDSAAAELALLEGDVGSARSWAESGLAAARGVPARVGDVLAEALLAAARVALAEDAPDEAVARLAELLDEIDRGMQWLLPATVLELAGAAARAGSLVRAAELCGLWDAISTTGRKPAPLERDRADALCHELGVRVDRADFEAARARGREAGASLARDVALELSSTRTPARSPRGRAPASDRAARPPR